MTPAHRPRVLHVIGALDVGGAERVALDLCPKIPAADVDQVFVCLAGRPGTLAPQFEALGATVLPLSARPYRDLLFRFLNLVRANRPTVVQSHVSLASAPLLAVAGMLRVPTRIARMHSQSDDHGNGPARRLYRAAMRALLRLSATHILGVCDAATRFAIGTDKGLWPGRTEIHTIANGVDTARFRPGEPVPQEPLIAVHIGRAAVQKNRAALPRIAGALNRRRSTELRVVGTWDTHDIPDGADQLEIVGPVEDVRPELQRAHVLILPSTAEGLPGVVLEALSCDLPVVTTDLPGCREISADCAGVTLVPTDGTAEDWADAIVHAIDHRPPRGQIRNSIERSRFALAVNATEWRNLWGVLP